MITQDVSIKLIDLDDAPDYKGSDFKGIRIDNAIIVRKGTVCGNATIDLQCSDEAGKKYVIMVTGFIMDSIASANRGAQG